MAQVLRGLKVLDFSRLLPGPFCSYLLMEMGAQVTVIHAPKDQEVLTFPALRKNKKFIPLDLKSIENRKKVIKLIRAADVLLEGFRPAVMKRLSLDFATCRKINNKIIYASLTGYGQKGCDRAGHDLNYLASSGVLKALSPIGTVPQIPGLPLADLVGGLGAALQILAHLSIPKKSRKAQFLDISMTEMVKRLLIPIDDKAHKAILPVLNGHLARYQIYQTADSKALAVAPLEEKFWQKFVTSMQIPSKILQAGETHIIQWLKDAFLSHPHQYWLHKLADPDLCVTLIENMS